MYLIGIHICRICGWSSCGLLGNRLYHLWYPNRRRLLATSIKIPQLFTVVFPLYSKQKRNYGKLKPVALMINSKLNGNKTENEKYQGEIFLYTCLDTERLNHCAYIKKIILCGPHHGVQIT